MTSTTPMGTPTADPAAADYARQTATYYDRVAADARAAGQMVLAVNAASSAVAYRELAIIYTTGRVTS